MTSSQNLPLLIFDLDGTLIDSAVDIHLSMNQMLKKYNKPDVDLAVLKSHIGDGLTVLVHDFFPENPLNSEATANKVDEFLSIYRTQNLTRYTCLFEGVFDFLQTYKGPKAIVTNKSIKPTHEILAHFKIDTVKWVDIIGGDSLAERKPSALPLLHVMKLANYSAENTWMIGDGRPDMKSANAAGCIKVAVHYGYSKPEELAVFEPNKHLESFSHIHHLLKS